MGGEAEAAGDALTGAIIAHTIEGQRSAGAASGGACLNCGATLTGAYCIACGQSAHIHRSLRSLGHDIVHGVFHFEGKFWRTMPELLFRPGRLTRRYIDGERAKFVSPMALFLFTVFAMFAVLSFSPGGDAAAPRDLPDTVITEWKSGNQSALDNTKNKIETLRAERDEADITVERRAALDQQIAELESARQVMELMAGSGISGAWQGVDAERNGEGAARQPFNLNISTGWPALDRRLNEGAQAAQQNPGLLFYKLKTNSYKFSWMLIPLSLPFLWLMFFWRRDVHLYDHAIFATYSISFMMMLMIVLSILDSLNVHESVWALTMFVAPAHMYKQLRGAYGLSRGGAFARLVLLLISATVVLTIFFVLLLAIGVLA